MSVNVKKL